MGSARISIVTGGASGMGRATAIRLAEQQDTVVVVDMSVLAGEETVELIRKDGGEAQFIQADVSSAEDVSRYVSETVREHGRIDAFFNNAGIEGAAALWADYSEAEFDHVVAVNMKGVWLGIKEVAAVMVRRGRGSIVNTASISALEGQQYNAPYCASKAGVLALTRCAVREFADKGLRINAICPGPIDTPLMKRVEDNWGPGTREQVCAVIPAGRYGDPEEIAQAVVFLLSDRSSFVNGAILPIDGGWTSVGRI